jgi:hypothetical protein
MTRVLSTRAERVDVPQRPISHGRLLRNTRQLRGLAQTETAGKKQPQFLLPLRTQFVHVKDP